MSKPLKNVPADKIYQGMKVTYRRGNEVRNDEVVLVGRHTGFSHIWIVFKSENDSSIYGDFHQNLAYHFFRE